jgi:predicted acyl esterase
MKKFVTGFGLLAVMLMMLGAVGFTTTVGVIAAATEAATPEPQEIKIKMADGLEILGTFYASAAQAQAPAVLLLHQYQGSRSQWAAFTAVLNGKGYNVLAVDQRGFGETGSTADWKLAQTDATALMTWLRQQPTVNPDKVAIVGASVGANVALMVCASDPKCHTAIALSPGTNFFDVISKDAVLGMKDQAIFLVASQGDQYSSDATVKALTVDAPTSLTTMTKIYAGTKLHGTDMLVYPDLIPTMLQWLDTYTTIAN